MARNIIERIFGVLKSRFAILTHRPHYDLDTQARLAPALGTIHNFIRDHDPDEINDLLEDLEAQPREYGHLADGPARAAERGQANDRRDAIAQSMWEQYQQQLRQR
jgi:hypothetical protein